MAAQFTYEITGIIVVVKVLFGNLTREYRDEMIASRQGAQAPGP
jgi:hypothetical protein